MDAFYLSNNFSVSPNYIILCIYIILFAPMHAYYIIIYYMRVLSRGYDGIKALYYI
jgi:hypothetical protein